MSTWTYNGEKFTSMETAWDDVLIKGYPSGVVEKHIGFSYTECLVFHPKWDKCFWLVSLGIHGSGNKLKAYIEDVYSGKGCWVEARKLEIVSRLN